MVLTEFLQNLTSGNLLTLSQQAAIAPQTITGQTVDIQTAASESFQQAFVTFQTILSGGGLPETQFEAVTTQNLLGLGQASIDISTALNEQIAIRERQRIIDTQALQNTQLAIGQINERLSTQISELGKSLTGISTGTGFDPIKFFTDNPLIGGIGIGGLLVGGVVLLLVLR